MDKLDGLDRVNDGILAMLQDIKQMVFGCGLLLLGISLAMFAALFGFSLLWLGAIPFLFSGCLHIWNGWRAHEVVETGSSKPNALNLNQSDQ